MGNKTEPLSRRDQLAAIIMQGLIIANAGKQVSRRDMANTAVNQTDALIKALNEQA